jgi:hypothetical protein
MCVGVDTGEDVGVGDGEGLVVGEGEGETVGVGLGEGGGALLVVTDSLTTLVFPEVSVARALIV